jgi:hypothetical protein
MPGWLTPVAAAIAGLAVGFCIGRNGGGEAAPVAPTAAAAVPDARDAAAAFTLSDVRRVVREELAARTMAGAAGASHSTVTPAAPDATQSAAASRASSTLDSALARRTWTETDSQALREDFANMAPGQRAEWLQKFSMAVNQGSLVPESERSPF